MLAALALFSFVVTLFLVVGVIASQGATPGIKGGKFEVTCKLANSQQIDPIVAPGQIMSAHGHDIFGNKNLTSTSTPDTLRGGSTTCVVPDDTAAYWVPQVIRTDTGAIVPPVKIFAYYFGDPAGTVETIPAGAEIVAGNSQATTPQGKTVISWSCGNGGTASKSPVLDHPYDCTDPAYGVVGSQGVVAIVKFPYCWDGTAPTGGNDTAHYAYGNSKGVCQAPFPHRLPQLQVHVHYGASKQNPGFQQGNLIQLTSDAALGLSGGVTEHGDVMFAWNQARFDSLVASCLNTHTDCGFLAR